MKQRQRQRGFTLLEVVVAFAILALSLSALFESFSMTLRRSEKARNLERAVLLIESIKDQLGITVSLSQTSVEGNEEDCHWQVHGQAVARPASDRAPTATADRVGIDVDCGNVGALGRAHLDAVELVPAR
jgi:general secretion pathway protein I